MRRIVAAAALALLVLLSSVPAEAHGHAKIVDHHIARLDGAVRASGTYRVGKRHEHIFVTVFIIQGNRILASKTNSKQTARRVHISLTAECRNTGPVYAVIQGDVRGGGHFAKWNTRQVVCQR